MSWNQQPYPNQPYPPPNQPHFYPDPNQQGYYGQQQPGGYPPQPGFGQPQPGYPPQGFPQPGNPPQGYPQPSYPPQAGGGYGQPSYPPQAGFQQPGLQPGFGQPGGAFAGGMGGFHMPPPSGYIQNDEGGEGVKGFEFNDESIRKSFIRKVYSILMCQLLLTFGFICMFKFHEPTKLWVARNPWLFWVSLAVLFVTLICMACCESVRRTAPTNFIFLGLFTLAQGFMLGVTTIAFSSDEVMLAVGITAVVCFSLTLFAFQTKWDFTVMGGVLFVAVIILMLMGIVGIFWPGKTMSLIYGCFGALIFSIYLIYDTQLMMGGKHKYSISPEEYIFASLNLYMDIINIFIYILTIIGATRD